MAVLQKLGYVGFLDFYQMLSYQGYVDPFGYMYQINIMVMR